MAIERVIDGAVRRLDTLWAKSGAFVSKAFAGLSAVLLIMRVIPQYKYLLPPEWAVFALAITGALFLAGYGLGFYALVMFMGLLSVAAFGSLGSLLFVIAIIAFPSVGSIIRSLIVAFPGMKREFQLGSAGAGNEALLVLFAPFLFAANLGFAVPLLAGLNFGFRGIATAVSSCVLSSIVWALCGAIPWGFPSKVPGTADLLRVTIPQAGNRTVFDILRPRALWDGSGATITTTSYLPDFTKLPHVMAGGWTVVRTSFAARPLLWAQVILWGLCAYVIARLRGEATSSGKRAVAVLAGAAVLAAGYALLPVALGSGSDLALPGGAGLFIFYFATSLAIALLPCAVVSGSGYAARSPTGARPAVGVAQPPSAAMGRLPEPPGRASPLVDPTAGVGQPAPPAQEPRTDGKDKKIKIEL